MTKEINVDVATLKAIQLADKRNSGPNTPTTFIE
jgi:hypothetical protein